MQPGVINLITGAYSVGIVAINLFPLPLATVNVPLNVTLNWVLFLYTNILLLSLVITCFQPTTEIRIDLLFTEYTIIFLSKYFFEVEYHDRNKI